MVIKTKAVLSTATAAAALDSLDKIPFTRTVIMRKWQKKLVSILAAIFAASLSVQLLLLLPRPTAIASSKPSRSVLKEDRLASPKAKDTDGHLVAIDVQKELDSIIIPLKSLQPTENHPTPKDKAVVNSAQKANLPLKPDTGSKKVAGLSKIPLSSERKEKNSPVLGKQDKDVNSQPSRPLLKSVDSATKTEIEKNVHILGDKLNGSKTVKTNKASIIKSRETVPEMPSKIETHRKKSNNTGQEQSVKTRTKYRVHKDFRKWLILDGLRQACSDVSVYTQGNTNWHVMIVNNGEKAAKGCKPENCEEHHGTDINQAYLKVITSGADVIVLADCVARYIQLDHNFLVNDAFQYGLYYNATDTFNPYEFAGYESLFPKSISLWDNPMNRPPDWSKPLTVPSPNSERFFVTDFRRVSFRQGFRLGEDICACALASSSVNTPAADVMDNPVVAGDSTLVALDTGPSLALPDAFYWLFVPPGLFSQRAVLTYRTLWMHALKRAGLIHIGLFHITALMNPIKEDSSKIPKDCVDAKSPKSETRAEGTLNQDRVTFTATFKAAFHCVQQPFCKSDKDELACATLLSVEVLKCLGVSEQGNNFLQEHNEAIRAWFHQLTAISVPLPRPRPLRVAEQIKNSHVVKYNAHRQHIYRNPRHNTTAKMKELQQIKKAVVDPMLKKCSGISHFKFPESWGPRYTKNSDVALVVSINYEFLYKTIAHVEFVHRQSFRFIVYCGPNMTSFTNFVKQHGGLDHVTFIDGGWTGSTGWHTIYRCLTLAMKLRLPVKGYLQVGEDVLINSKNVAPLPRDKVWILNNYSKRDVNVEADPGKWYHWDKVWGRQALLNLLRQLKTSANYALSSDNNYSNNNNSSEDVDRFGENLYGDDILTFRSPVPGRSPRDVKRAASRFLHNYVANLGNLDIVVNRATDFFYVPVSWQQDYIILAEIFQYSGVIIEFAFPMLHLGMTLKKDVMYVHGASLWRDDRDISWRFYKDSLVFLHPFKSIKNLENKEGHQFFCGKFLKDYEAWVHT